ncbi:Hypothetical predicted protein [Mytilus galloprovincialis]|uniref:Fucolectin tachylectin-4 pentraxin-1 domain-containing protein n=3 Tax=Mytilus galloprovincialis TaxID=29158 RepID=A0A8B6DP99_MYTGA|nr:Hypothetical predicted protein [Mytilus galloprovincialis]
MEFGKMLYCATGLILGCIVLSSACKLSISDYKGKLVTNQMLANRILRIETTMKDKLKRHVDMLKTIMEKSSNEGPLPHDMCLEDVAFKKMSGQSSRFYHFHPRLGNDGDITSFFHTSLQRNPYWWVDLGSFYKIHHVEIWNRGSSGHRLRALTITVGPTLQKARSTCAYFNGPARNGQHLVIKCSKKTAKGRVVKLTQRTYKGYMHLAEVKVFAYKKNCVPKEETFML